jgi:hypothetical protein
MGEIGDDELRPVVEELESIPRLPTSPGERLTARLIADRFTGLLDPGRPARIEEADAYRSYAWPIGLLSAVAVASAMAARRQHRSVGVVGGLLAAAGIIDDITGGPMLTRRLFMRRHSTPNVIADSGDQDAAVTLVVLAHHDAAPSGVVFASGVETWLADRHPEVIRRMTSNPPLWWPVVAGPVLVAAGSLGALSGSAWGRRLVRFGAGLSFTALLAMLDIGHRPAVPGANDNLSGVAALLAAAGALTADPPENVRLIFASMGAEEALQQGVRGFARRHFNELPTETTFSSSWTRSGSAGWYCWRRRGRSACTSTTGGSRISSVSAPRAWASTCTAGCARTTAPTGRCRNGTATRRCRSSRSTSAS